MRLKDMKIPEFLQDSNYHRKAKYDIKHLFCVCFWQLKNTKPEKVIVFLQTEISYINFKIDEKMLYHKNSL